MRVLNIIKPGRLNGLETQLHLGFIKPHGEVKSSTVSRWLKEILNAADIDVNAFKDNSTWSALEAATRSVL